MWEAKGGVNAPDLAHHIQFMRDKFQGRQSPAARGDHVPAHGSATRPVPISATWSPLAPHPGNVLYFLFYLYFNIFLVYFNIFLVYPSSIIVIEFPLSCLHNPFFITASSYIFISNVLIMDLIGTTLIRYFLSYIFLIVLNGAFSPFSTIYSRFFFDLSLSLDYLWCFQYLF
jgi:hypothetical protein